MQLPLKYLQHYPLTIQQQVKKLHSENLLEQYIVERYSLNHTIQTDRNLYEFCNILKQTFLRNAPLLDKVLFDNSITIEHHALGLNTKISRVQGGKLKAKREIRISPFFKETPIDFLRMIVVHELAHLKESDHNKAFYQLCQHMEPDYHQLELDCRIYLYWKSTNATHKPTTS